MKILLFGVTNVGKSTIGKMLSQKLKYDYDDLDDEIKRRYKRIDTFQAKYPYDYERHKERGRILLDIIKKYHDNVVIAVSPIFYEEFFIPAIDQTDVLAIELQDEIETNLKYDGITIHIQSLKEYKDEDFKLYIIQERKYLKLCKHCGKAFVANNPKAEYDTFSCKNQEESFI